MKKINADMSDKRVKRFAQEKYSTGIYLFSTVIYEVVLFYGDHNKLDSRAGFTLCKELARSMSINPCEELPRVTSKRNPINQNWRYRNRFFSALVDSCKLPNHLVSFTADSRARSIPQMLGQTRYLHHQHLTYLKKEIPMSENINLFDLYLSNNLQLGVGDLMEVKALRENKNVRSYRFSIDAGRFNNFNPQVSEETKNKQFSKVTSHRMGNSNESSVYEYYWLGDEIVAIVYTQVQYKNSTTTIICHEDVFECLAEDLRNYYEDPAMRFVSKIKISPDGSVHTTRERLLDRETERPFNEFYPFLPNGMGYKEFFDLYLKSRAAVLVLIGPPGTGKSTFLRALINYTNSDGFMIYDDDTKSRIEALDHFYANDGTVLAIEDADKHIGKRTNDNEAMAGFLNYTDGVIRNTSKKLVISTNLASINSIDEALLRPGRCFAVLQFRNLTSSEARAARLAAGMPDDIDFSNRSEIPLASALDDSNVVTQRTAHMGFCG